MHPREFYKISKTKIADKPAKNNPDTLPHLGIASVEQPRLETTDLKNVCICKVVCAMLYSALCN
jgi:hypothetical protein